MEMFKDNKFTVLRDDGTSVTCDVLFTFDSEETGKSYVVYTDGTPQRRHRFSGRQCPGLCFRL